MKNECSIVRDLLPLYAEHMVSEETADFVKAHLEQCEDCRKRFGEEQEHTHIQVPTPELPLVNLRHKLTAKRIQTIVFTTIFVAVMLISVFAVMTAPEYLPYSPQLFSLTEHDDGSISIVFDSKVTDYRCTTVPDSDAPQGIYYAVEAWSSPWNRHFANRGIQSVTIQPDGSAPLCVYYISNNGSTDDTCIYGQPLVPNGGMMTLPRLALGFYLMLMLIGLILLLVLWFLVRRKLRKRVLVEQLLLYPVAYALSHLIVVGFTTISYAMQRDLGLIILLSLLLYSGFLLAHTYYRMHRIRIKNP